MEKQITMKFRRDDYSGPACLEYSWVPEGLRHTIRLNRGQQEGSRTDRITVDPSHVQVYVLDNNNAVSAEKRQFPPAPPHGAPVVGATVDVYQQPMAFVGTVHYANGTAASDRQPMDPFSRPCPERSDHQKGVGMSTSGSKASRIIEGGTPADAAIAYVKSFKALTKTAIADNYEGATDKYDVGVWLGLEDGTSPGLLVVAPTLLRGRVEEDDISSKEWIVTKQQWFWYIFVDGKRVTKSSDLFEAPAGKYYAIVGIKWRRKTADEGALTFLVEEGYAPLAYAVDKK